MLSILKHHGAVVKATLNIATACSSSTDAIMTHPPVVTVMITLNRKLYIHLWGPEQQAWPLGGRKAILLLSWAISETRGKQFLHTN